jgi:hypothetical protein
LTPNLGYFRPVLLQKACQSAVKSGHLVSHSIRQARVNIYFSCSITGGRKDQGVYAAIVKAIMDEGHEVPTAHLSSPDILSLESIVSPAEVYQRDVGWVEECDALIAEVSTPSHGVGYEIALALMLGKPVLCLYRSGARVSKMITGNNHPGLRQTAYTQESEAVTQVCDYLHNLSLNNISSSKDK